MEKKKIDWIISIIREQMVANAPGGSGGFSGSAEAKGPTAGFDPVMGLRRRKGPQIKLPPGSRKRWMKPE
ncbi:MAG: hypothetical protein EBR30_19165 [Cytophagia bacterium]|jgi:hypothetical protein|nr:hypothetical protein [Cytophagia bacterium]